MKISFQEFTKESRLIASFRVGTKIIDISGRVSTITRHENSITWVETETGTVDCYANCANVISYDTWNKGEIAL